MPVSRAAKVALLFLCSASIVNAKPPNAIFGVGGSLSSDTLQSMLVDD